MLTIRYIHAFGNLMSRRLWATCKFGSLEQLAVVWSAYCKGEISAADYHQRAAELLG
jgi:hypothetical protein